MGQLHYPVRPRPRRPKPGRHTHLRARPTATLTVASPLQLQAHALTAAGVFQNPTGGESGGIELVVVNTFGERFGTLAGASLRSCTWEKNDVPTAAVSFNTKDDDYAARLQAALPDILSRELQIWRNGRLLWWGVPVRTESDAETTTVQFSGLLWYFTRRFFGRANRENLLLDPGFEDLSSTAWEAVGTTFERSTAHKQVGERAAKLTQANAQTDTYIRQRIDDYPATAVGTLLTLVGWFWIDPDAWVGEAQGRRGLVIARYETDGVTPVSDGLPPAAAFFIDGNMLRGSWQRAECAVVMPFDAINDLEVRCYSPGGVIYWDALSLTIMESLSSAEGPNDFEMEQTKIARRIVEHGQDPAYGKDDRNITTNCPPSGVQRVRHYQFADHQSIWEALSEFPQLSNGFDFSIEHPDPHTRVFTTHYPRIGSYKPEFALEAGKNLADNFKLSLDGEQVANNVTVLSVDADGPDREEGGATDTSEYGVDVEAVFAAPQGAPIDSLVERAEEHLASHLRPETLDVVVVEDLDGAPIGEQERARRIVDGLRPGDRVPVRLLWGVVDVDDVYEAVRCEYLADSNALRVTLNRWTGDVP